MIIMIQGFLRNINSFLRKKNRDDSYNLMLSFQSINNNEYFFYLFII